MIVGYVVGQALTIDTPVIASDSVNYIEARFVFLNRDWDGLAIHAIFDDGDVAYTCPLKDGRVAQDNGLNLGAGTWRVHLVGSAMDGDVLVRRITTNPAKIEVVCAGRMDGEPVPPARYTDIEEIEAALTKKIDAPQVAQIGEVLTVEEVDEDGKPIKWKAAKVSGTFVCTFNDGEDGWITCDKTVEEIITANNDGKDVIGHYYGDIYRLSTPFETGGGYGNPIFSNLGVGVLSIIQYDGGHFKIYRIRLSDIAPEDAPDPYEVPVCVPTKDGMRWQYGRPLLATDYHMNELTDEEKALMQKNLGIDDLPSPATAQVGQIVKVKSVDESGKITETEAVDLDYVKNYYSWNEFKPELQAGQRPEIVMLSNQSHGADDNVPSHDWVYPCVLYFSRQGNTSYSYLMVGADGSTYAISYSHTKGNFSIVQKRLNIPSPETVLVGQIIKVKTIRDGIILETEAVDMPTQKTLKWITVQSFDLTETKRELIISTDTDGKSIADYNPVGLSLILSTPADSTEESTNGAPWIYPSTTKFDNAIRVIGNISGWKTIARDSAFVFNGGSSAMSCSGNVNTSLPTYKLDGYALDGVRIFFNGTNDHLPVGTHVEVAILCEVAE